MQPASRWLQGSKRQERLVERATKESGGSDASAKGGCQLAPNGWRLRVVMTTLHVPFGINRGAGNGRLLRTAASDPQRILTSTIRMAGSGRNRTGGFRAARAKSCPPSRRARQAVTGIARVLSTLRAG